MEKRSKKRSFMDFMIYFIVKIKNDDIFALGAQLAYYLMLSFFPFLIFLMMVVGYSSIDTVEVMELMESLEGIRTVVPDSAFELIRSIVNEVFTTRSSGILGLSVILTIWSASSGFRAAIKGINKAYNIKETRNFFKRIFIAIICTFLLVSIIFVTLIVLVFGDVLGNYLSSILPFESVIDILWNYLRYAIIIVVMMIVFASIYRYTPCKRLSWREVFPGAIASTLGWLAISSAFSFYVNNFSNYSQLYGSLGAVFMLMTWLYVSSIIFILGVEINAVLVNNKEIL